MNNFIRNGCNTTKPASAWRAEACLGLWSAVSRLPRAEAQGQTPGTAAAEQRCSHFQAATRASRRSPNASGPGPRIFTRNGCNTGIFTFTGLVRRVLSGVWLDSLPSYGTLLLALIVAGLTGCSDRNAVEIALQTRTAEKESALRLEIQGVVTGPQAGLRYKWMSVSGQCEPQESEVPSTVFKFAEGVKQDCVTVEVWRDGKRIAQNEIAVKFAGEIAELADPEKISEVKIEITGIPPAEAGGEDTRANISGQVRGKIQPDYRVVIYAHAYDSWYMQPTAHDLHSIQADNTWSSWTHTGEQYAALVVSSGFAPRVRSDMLPSVGDHVLAKAIVEGIKK